MAGYTPGPWMIEHVGPRSQTPQIVAGIRRVAECASFSDEDHANAILIAAAPELLAAARLAVDAIGNTRDDFGLKLELEKAYLALRAAIANTERR